MLYVIPFIVWSVTIDGMMGLASSLLVSAIKLDEVDCRVTVDTERQPIRIKTYFLMLFQID